jgi:bifunctional UDP-N-acetylglucosamine pyrophosphorylase/glucosamine-1-phosphate N-acetyltransferase
MAAGKGVRMKSALPKVLHRVLGRPIVEYPVRLGLECCSGPCCVVCGDSLPQIREALAAQANGIVMARQEQALGTADAVAAGIRALDAEARDFDTVLILNGDVPGLSKESVEGLLAGFEDSGESLRFMAFRAPDPTGYGRVLREPNGRVVGIREHKELRGNEAAIDLVNAGIYLVRAGTLRNFLAQVKVSPIQGEYLLPDIVEFTLAAGGLVDIFTLKDHREMLGVNNRADLALVLDFLRERRNFQLMVSGVGMDDPASVTVDLGAELDADVQLERDVTIRGRCRIGQGSRVGQGSVLTDTILGPGTTVLPYCVMEGTQTYIGCTVGPFTHTRSGTVLSDGAKLGNFVETKKSRIGKGSKVNHLSYIGDALVGDKVNIGAGTITCNYDGYEKHQTIIGDGVFIGSDVKLVAPVTVGAGALVAAGSTITKDVPDGALGMARSPQENLPGWAEERRRRKDAVKAAKKPSDH